MKNILITYLLVMSSSLFGQDGDYLLTHYNPRITGVDNANFAIAVDNNGLISLANRSGLIQFDGSHWDHIPAPVALLSLNIGEDGTVFAGGVNDFGFFDHFDKEFRYISLSKEEEFDELFFQTLVDDQDVYFLGENSLVRYNIAEGNSAVIDSPEGEYFLSMFLLKGEVYTQSESSILQLSDSSLAETSFKLPDFSEVQFMRKHPSQDEYLFGSTLNQLYLLKGDQFNKLKVSDDLMALGYYAYDGAWISDSLFAVSTLEAGCLVLDVNSDKLEKEINYGNGLPDNEVLAIVGDNENGLWIAHEYGLTRVVPDVPILSFSNYPGMNGNLLSVKKFDDRTYVSTSGGVYFFDKENTYRNNVYYTKESINPRKKKVQPKPQAAPKVEEQPKKKLLGRLFKKKESADKQTDQPKEKKKKGLFGRLITKVSDFSKEVKILKGKPDKNIRYVRRVKRELISTRYLYKKVDGLDSKTKQLLTYKDKLLAISNSGMYEVNDSTASLIIDEPIQYAYATKDHLVVATYDHQLRVYELLDDLWIETHNYEVTGEIVVNIFSDQKERLWVITTNSMYQIDPNGLDQQDLPYAEIPNQFIDQVRATIIEDKIYLINSSGYFYYDEESRSVKADSMLLDQLGLPLYHLQQSDGVVWVFDGQAWIRLGEDKKTENFRLLGLFPDMSFIDEINGELWIIDNTEEIYRFDPNKNQDIAMSNRMFIRSVRNTQGEVGKKGDIDFSFDNNSITFELSRPDYLGISQVEYKYYLEGIMEEWSSWVTSNSVDFNYLPPGDYTLQARSKDVFGLEQVSNPFSFTIEPPYWQTPWFYALQIIFFAALVVGSARLNRATKRNYGFLTAALTLLTIVLIIEFLQTIAGSSLGIESTPVVDFAIDATIALLIFPIELVLKKVIKSGAEIDKLKAMLKPKELGKIE